MNIRYFTCCLGVNISPDGKAPTKVFGDKLSVILRSANSVYDLLMKNIAIIFNVVREAIAAGTIELYWIKGIYNIRNIMNKQIPSGLFYRNLDYIY